MFNYYFKLLIQAVNHRIQKGNLFYWCTTGKTQGKFDLNPVPFEWGWGRPI